MNIPENSQTATWLILKAQKVLRISLWNFTNENYISDLMKFRGVVRFHVTYQTLKQPRSFVFIPFTPAKQAEIFHLIRKERFLDMAELIC